MRSRKPESLLEKNRAGPIIAFYGENTDWIGINTCISRNLSPVNTVNSHTTGLVLGAGGMARATIYAMIRLGVRTIFLNNRTYDKAEEVASHFNNLSSQNNSMANGPEQSEWDRLSKNLVKPHDHFEYRPTIRVLESNDEPWPADTDAPTIIVSSLPGRDPGTGSIIENTIPENWLTSQTGGVAIEVKKKHFPRHPSLA
jgi:hypothetical protein